MKYFKVELTRGQTIQAPARFLWKGEIVDMNYVMIHSFTIEKHKEAIMAEVKELSVEEVPMVAFVEFEGNPKLLKWIEQTLTRAIQKQG